MPLFCKAAALHAEEVTDPVLAVEYDAVRHFTVRCQSLDDG